VPDEDGFIRALAGAGFLLYPAGIFAAISSVWRRERRRRTLHELNVGDGRRRFSHLNGDLLLRNTLPSCNNIIYHRLMLATFCHAVKARRCSAALNDIAIVYYGLLACRLPWRWWNMPAALFTTPPAAALEDFIETV
jgi:hypothetical protein